MKIITINKENIDIEHICCAIGNDKANKNRTETKKDWMKARFNEGLIFKRLDERGKIFIEYIPIEKVWKPIKGKNYLVINCLWVSGKFKGQGISNLLLNECIKDAKDQNKDGIAVITSNKVKTFLTDKNFYLKKGFEIVDSAFPYFELLVLKLNKNADNPKFTLKAKEGKCENKDGFTFIFSNQCPFTEEYTFIYTEILKDKKIPYKIIKLNNPEEAQNQGSPFGTFGIFYNGKFKTHELMPDKKFYKWIEEIGALF